MNLPNKITVSRMIMVPVFLIFLLGMPVGDASRYIAVIIFIVAALTDMIDGKIARKYNLITNFGKFMDPLADKLLVAAALISMTELEMLPAWMTIILISREFIITGFRLIAVEKGLVIAAGMWGKVKTVVQMVMIPVVLLWPYGAMYNVLGRALIWASVALSVISLIEYLSANREVLKG
ncbi:MAG: CDP-diacylglycerol--glycerol-3-phosphate 3-phosphatidyltransferase [Firmicutes bacterium]|nr:CDP-diacylglycerol--glycerol-3-phosphate 3-phosphatidyltransferase [Bacillota bacterium]